MASALGRVLQDRGIPVRAIAGRDRERTRIAAEFIGGTEAVTLELLCCAIASFKGHRDFVWVTREA